MKFPEKMKVAFKLDNKTTVDKAKQYLESINKTFDKELMLKHCRYTLSMKQYLLIFSLMAVFSIISFASNYTDSDYIVNITKATALGDTYAIQEINSKLYGFTHIFYVFFIVHGGMTLVKFLYIRDFMKDLDKAKKEIQGYADDKTQHKLPDGEFELIQLSFDSDALNLKGRLTTLLSVVFMTIMFSTTVGFSSETGSVSEHKGEGELKAIELNSLRPTIYFRDNDQLNEIKIPSRVDYKIVFDDAKDANPRFEFYYRRHGGTDNYKGYILSKENRSSDYYFKIILPENFNLQGSLR